MKKTSKRMVALVLMLVMVCCCGISVSASTPLYECYNAQSVNKPGGGLIGAEFYGDYMYVPFRSNSNGGFYVYDISKPTSISQAKKIQIDGWKGPVDGIKPVLVDGDYLYIGFNNKGYINKYYLKATPDNPQYVCTYDTTTETNSYGIDSCSYIEKVNGKLVIAKVATEVWAFDDTETTVFAGDANANLVKVTNLTQVNGSTSFARYGNHNIIDMYGDYVYTLGKNNGLATAFNVSDFTYKDYHAYRSKSPEFYDMAISDSGVVYVLATDECNTSQNTAINSTAYNVKLKAVDLTPTTNKIAQCQNWIKDGAPTYLFEDTARVITTKKDGTTRVTSMAISDDGTRLAVLNATDGDINDNANGDGTGSDLDIIYMYDISTPSAPVFINTINVPTCDFVTFDNKGNIYCTGMSAGAVFAVERNDENSVTTLSAKTEQADDTVTATVTNGTDFPVNVWLIAASYNGNKLVDTECSVKTIVANKEDTVEVLLTNLDTTDADRVEVFTWNGTTLTPLCDSLPIN